MPSPAPGSRTWSGCAAASSTMSSPPSTRRASASTLLRVGRPGGLGLLEMLERFLLEPVGERLVAGVELLAGLAEIFSLGLRLLVLGEELLLDLGRGLGPHGRGQRQREGDGGGAEDVSHRVLLLGWGSGSLAGGGQPAQGEQGRVRAERAAAAEEVRCVRRQGIMSSSRFRPAGRPSRWRRRRRRRGPGRRRVRRRNAGSGLGQVAVAAPEEEERAPVARL